MYMTFAVEGSADRGDAASIMSDGATMSTPAARRPAPGVVSGNGFIVQK